MYAWLVRTPISNKLPSYNMKVVIKEWSIALTTERKSQLPDAAVRDWIYTYKLCEICHGKLLKIGVIGCNITYVVSKVAVLQPSIILACFIFIQFHYCLAKNYWYNISSNEWRMKDCHSSFCQKFTGLWSCHIYFAIPATYQPTHFCIKIAFYKAFS